MEEEEAKLIFLQILSAVDYCHARNIAHCDLKFENILYDEHTGELKLIDFGFSVEDPQSNPPTVLCGTPSYMSPEEMLKKDIEFFKADVWSLGVILFKLLTGIFPFRGNQSANAAKTQMELSKKIIKAEYTYPSNVALSSAVKKLLRRIFNPSYDKRPATRELLNDEWFYNTSEPVSQQDNLRVNLEDEPEWNEADSYGLLEDADYRLQPTRYPH